MKWPMEGRELSRVALLLPNQELVKPELATRGSQTAGSFSLEPRLRAVCGRALPPTQTPASPDTRPPWLATAAALRSWRIHVRSAPCISAPARPPPSPKAIASMYVPRPVQTDRLHDFTQEHLAPRPSSSIMMPRSGSIASGRISEQRCLGGGQRWLVLPPASCCPSSRDSTTTEARQSCHGCVAVKG